MPTLDATTPGHLASKAFFAAVDAHPLAREGINDSERQRARACGLLLDALIGLKPEYAAVLKQLALSEMVYDAETLVDIYADAAEALDEVAGQYEAQLAERPCDQREHERVEAAVYRRGVL